MLYYIIYYIIYYTCTLLYLILYYTLLFFCSSIFFLSHPLFSSPFLFLPHLTPSSQSSFPLPSFSNKASISKSKESLSRSKYTCRHLDILIYVRSNSRISDPAQTIGGECRVVQFDKYVFVFWVLTYGVTIIYYYILSYTILFSSVLLSSSFPIFQSSPLLFFYSSPILSFLSSSSLPFLF